ncbi:uncharacterized [Tachysurus ichikawai]
MIQHPRLGMRVLLQITPALVPRGFPLATPRVGKSSDVNPSLSSLHFEVLTFLLFYLSKMEGSSLELQKRPGKYCM